MQDENGISFFGALWNGLIWFIQNIAEAFYNFGYAITHPQLWLDWSNKEAIMRFVYYGGSVEFFFVIFAPSWFSPRSGILTQSTSATWRGFPYPIRYHPILLWGSLDTSESH